MSFAVQVPRTTRHPERPHGRFRRSLVKLQAPSPASETTGASHEPRKSPQKRIRAEGEAYNIKDLAKEISKATKDKEAYVRETTRKRTGS